MRVAFLLALIIGSVRTYAQDECRDMLVTVIGNMKKINAEQFSMAYQVRTKIFNSDDNVEEVDDLSAALFIRGNKSKFISDDMEMYKDETLQVTVMKDERKIYVMKSIPLQTKEVQKQALGILQDSLLKWVSITNCETICDSKDPKWFFEKIETRLQAKKMIESSGISQITYWIDRKNNRISRIKINYNTHPENVSEIDLNVLKYDKDYKGEAFKGNAYDVVFSSKNLPQSKYKGFEVVDFR